MKMFIKEKPAKALVFIHRNQNTDDVFVSKISRRVDTTYAHSCKIIEKLEEEGYVESEKRGRKKFLTLTDEGEQMAMDLGDIMGTGIFSNVGKEHTSSPISL